MDSNATTVLLRGFGPLGSPSLMVCRGLSTTQVEPPSPGVIGEGGLSAVGGSLSAVSAFR